MAILKALQVLLMCSRGWELGEKTTSKSRLGRDLIVLGLQGNRELALPSPRSALNGRKLRSRPQTRGSRCGQDPVSFSSPFLPPYCLFSCDNIYAGWRAGNRCVCMCVVRLSTFFSFFNFLAMLHGTRDLSSPTKGQTQESTKGQAPCSRSMDS